MNTRNPKVMVRVPWSSNLRQRCLWAFAGLVLAVLGLSARAHAQDGEAGLVLSAGYSGDLRRSTHGGLEQGTAYSDLLDLAATWTANDLFANARMTTNLSLMHLGGAGVSGDYLGDLQGVNNIEGPASWRLYEFWSEFDFGREGGSTLRAGVLDLNAEFDAPVTTAMFAAPPHGIGSDLSQSGGNGPSIWPAAGLGLRVAGVSRQGLQWRLGAYDGLPGARRDDAFVSLRVNSREGALLIGELGYSSGRINKLSIGTWSYTSAFDRLDSDPAAEPRRQHGNRGSYALFDLRLAMIGDSRIDGALRAGTADPRFNIFDQYLGAAVTITQPFAGRADDAIGIALARGHVGTPYKLAQQLSGARADSAETSIELTYRLAAADWLTLAPSIQFVDNPGADAIHADAWVVGLRFELAHEHTWPLSAQAARPAAESVARVED